MITSSNQKPVSLQGGIFQEIQGPWGHLSDEKYRNSGRPPDPRGKIQSSGDSGEFRSEPTRNACQTAQTGAVVFLPTLIISGSPIKEASAHGRHAEISTAERCRRLL